MMKAAIVSWVVMCVVAASAVAVAGQAQRGTVYKPGDGVTLPVLVKQVHPQYTQEAMRARIEGVVKLECVVLGDGTVDDVRVVQALDPGLDEEAIKAALQWRFKPGTKDGQPVAVQISLEMSFKLR
jgi:TonB family protein